MSIWTILFVVLLIAWIGGFTVLHVAGGLIHILLVFAVISLAGLPCNVIHQIPSGTT